MEERLEIHRSGGINRNILRLWGLLIAAAGILGRGVLQNRALGITTATPAELLELMSASKAAMQMATVALVLQAIEAAAVPIFAVLTMDGFQRTGSVKKYLLRMTGAALVSEIPYNLAMHGTLLDHSSRNPMFGLVLVLVMLYLFRYFGGKELSSILVNAAILAAAWMWAAMFRVEYGRSMVLISAALWFFRERHTLSLFMASAVALCCTVGSPLFMFAPFGFLIAHFYNGEEAPAPQALQYLLYPIILLLAAAAGRVLF